MSDQVAATSLRDKLATSVEQCSGFTNKDGTLEYPCSASKMDADRILGVIRGHLDGLLNNAVQIDGSHHKQWFLEEVARDLGITLDDHTPGIMP